MKEQGLTNSKIQTKTGLSIYNIKWILENEHCEPETYKRLADAVGVEPKELSLPELNNVDNGIEWIRDADVAYADFTQRALITKMKKFAKSYPNKVKILAENKDKSIHVQLPVSWIKITPRKELTEKQLEQQNKNLEKMRQSRGV